MKKIFYILVSAIVALGAVACENEGLENINPNVGNGEGLSFVATIDAESRVALNGTVNSWEVNDKVVIGDYTFICTGTDAEKGIFFCEKDNVRKDLIGKGEFTATYSNNGDGKVDSSAGAKGAVLTAKGSFTETAGVVTAEGFNFTLTSALLKFKASQNITFGSSNNLFSTETVEFDYENAKADANGFYYIAINAGKEYNLSYSIGGSLVMSKNMEFAVGKIYNLGELSAPTTTYYLIPNIWASDGAKFGAHFYTSAGGAFVDLMMTAGENGIYTCTVAEAFDKVIFCRMDAATVTFEWAKVWNQTGDLNVSAAPANYFQVNAYGADASEGEWVENPFAPVTPDEASVWSICGDFNSWGDTEMVTTTVKNVFVAKSVELEAYAQFKVRKNKAWGENYGAGSIYYMNTGCYIDVYSNSSVNISNTEAGTFDIYFDYLNKYVYLMTAGTDIEEATKQSKNGAAPDMSSSTWGVVGAHNSWGNDNELVWDGTLGLYVAKGVQLTGEFKVRADKGWATSFGSGGTVTVGKAAATTVYNNGGNCKLSSYSGTYDIYFWYDTANISANGKIWVYKAGSTAPTL